MQVIVLFALVAGSIITGLASHYLGTHVLFHLIQTRVHVGKDIGNELAHSLGHSLVGDPIQLLKKDVLEMAYSKIRRSLQLGLYSRF